MGVIIALAIIILWISNLLISLFYSKVSLFSPLFYLHILLQAYLFTGLFITGHDAMHGTVSDKKYLNNIFGYISVFLFAGMWYPRLIRYHQQHHLHPGTDMDPDYSSRSQNFWIWWLRFMARYVTIIQLIIMAIIYNILRIWFSDASIIFFWVIPAFLATLQLFCFGTFIPHRRPHTEDMKPYNARTLRRNHLWAMLSCYFFGYHHEHHSSPETPWWKLYRMKTS